MVDVVAKVQQILAAAYGVERRLAGTSNLALVPALTDVRTQLSGLVYRGFVTATGYRRLPDLVRYLRAVEHRLDKLPGNLARDREWMGKVETVQEEYRDLLATVPPDGPPGDALGEIRWMIEELRVSYFAQTIRTAHPVSDTRIYRAMDQIAP